MNAPRQPLPDHDPDPDPDEPITRWDATSCRVCHGLIVRPSRVTSRDPDGWRHVPEES